MPLFSCALADDVWQALHEHSARAGLAPDRLVDQALRELLGVGHPTLYQVSTAGAVARGLYQGAATVADLRQHGDLGLGTFDGLDGEMIVLDGEVVRVDAEGAVHTAPDDARTPFALVTRLVAPTPQALAPSDDLTGLAAALDRLRPSNTVFYAIRVDGEFERMRTRTTCRTEPGVPLAVAAAHQREFELGPLRGTLVGFWSPRYAGGLEIEGYHLHFLAADRTGGGHVLDCRAGPTSAVVQAEHSVHLVLPDTESFLAADLDGDVRAELDRAEH